MIMRHLLTTAALVFICGAEPLSKEQAWRTRIRENFFID